MTLERDRSKVIAAAECGLAAWNREEFGEAERADYIVALEVVLNGIGLFVENEALREFLEMVIDAELQAAPHIEVGDGDEQAGQVITSARLRRFLTDPDEEDIGKTLHDMHVAAADEIDRLRRTLIFIEFAARQIDNADSPYAGVQQIVSVIGNHAFDALGLANGGTK